uniref:Uncharacterized protein n=1 Tax=Arundo donax TaxID=35708 RepID=A0A0A9H9X1_ARUDO
MEKASHIIICLFFLNLTEAHISAQGVAGTFNVGVILDLQTLVGKMAHISISMALEDFYAIHRNYCTKLALHIRDSHGDDVEAVQQIFDAAIGDITIRHNRTSYVDFTLPYTESMVWKLCILHLHWDCYLAIGEKN